MYKLGIDVGGTNTDAVLVDENRTVVADIKYPTSSDIYDGILGAMRTVLDISGVDPKEIYQAMHVFMSLSKLRNPVIYGMGCTYSAAFKADSTEQCVCFYYMLKGRSDTMLLRCKISLITLFL